MHHFSLSKASWVDNSADKSCVENHLNVFQGRESSIRTTDSRGILVLVIVLLGMSLAGRVVFLSQSVNSDTAMFVYMGKLVSEGGRIGVDLIDNKLPSVGLLMSVPYRLIGERWWGYTLLGIVLMTLAPLFLARTTGRVMGLETFIPVWLAGTLWMNFPPMVHGLFQLETVQTFFVVLGVCFGLNLLQEVDWRDALGCGLCIGMGMWAKPTAAAVLPVIGITIWFATGWPIRRKLVATFWGILGVLTPVVTGVWLMMITGMLESFPDTIRQLREYASNSTADWVDVVKPLFVISVILFPVVVWGFVFRRDRLTTDVPVHCYKAVTWLAVGWFIMEMVGIVLQRRMYAYHFLPMAGPASLLMGLFARRFNVMSLGFSFGPLVLLSGIFVFQMLHCPDQQSRMSQVITYLKENASPCDRVWVDDYPRLMVETDLRPGARVPLVFLFGNSDSAPIRFSQMILRDFRDHPPDWVVLYEDPKKFIDFYSTGMAEMSASPARRDNFARAWMSIDEYVRKRYLKVTTIAGMDMYRKSESFVRIE